MSEDAANVQLYPTEVAPTDARHRASRWRVVVPPVTTPVTIEDVATHLRIDVLVDGLPNNSVAELTNWEMMIQGATDFAESLMETSLVPRTIEATFYRGEPITLPRGPLLDVEWVHDASGMQTLEYEIEHVGHSARIILNRALTYPVTVRYRAGYASFDEMPPSVRLAILTHVGTLFEARESTSDRPRTPVPHSLEAFYRLKSRGVGVG